MAKNVAIKYQTEIYKVLSLLIPIKPKIEIPHKTHQTTTKTSNGHSNSAYSFEVVIPMKRVTTANRIVIKYKAKCNFAIPIKNGDSFKETFKTLCEM